MTLRLAHISDLHFGRTVPAVVDALVDQLNSQRLDIVVVGGDLTQGARHREFAEARDFLDALTPATLVVPGNHDLPGWAFWNRFLRGYKRYRTYIDADLDVGRRIGEAGFVGLNTSRRFVNHWDWSNGAVSRRQLDFLEEQWTDIPEDGLRVLTLHHPLVPPPGRPGQKLVSNASRVARKASGLGADLVLTGHLHTTQVQMVSVRHDVDRNFPVVQTATSTSSRLRGHGNGFTVTEWRGSSMTVTTWEWAGQSFGHKTAVRFARDIAQGWHPID
ncbi:MAG: metallophosphoesterase family protein [Alphaproteobacteria bacterium]